MSDHDEPDLIALTEELLYAIQKKNIKRYRELVDESITCFEPEAAGYLVEGIKFHEYYFDPMLYARNQIVQTTMVHPRQRMLGSDAAVVSYVRLTQINATAPLHETTCAEETRVWQRRDGQWKNVHFHRSVPK